MSTATALHVYRVMFEIFAEAARWGVISSNVVATVRAPRPNRPALRIPTAEETRAILTAVAGSRAEGPAILAVACGLRLGESLGLRWADVDLDGERLQITGTMTRAGRTEPKTPSARRTVAIPPFAIAWLRQHRVDQFERRLASPAWESTDLVFDGGAGQSVSVESASRRFGQLVEQIGLGSVRLHDLRHAYATRLLEAGVHPKVVSEALGHSAVSITLDVYSHCLPSMSASAAAAIQAVFGE